MDEEKTIANMKENGLIKKSIVKEAEEMYREKFQEHRQTFCEVKQHEAIQYLKKQTGV